MTLEIMKLKDKRVSARLAEERKRLKISQKIVASTCAVSTKTVGRWESDVPIPSDKLSLLEALGFDILYIVTGTKTPENNASVPPLEKNELANDPQEKIMTYLYDQGAAKADTSPLRAQLPLYPYKHAV